MLHRYTLMSINMGRNVPILGFLIIFFIQYFYYFENAKLLIWNPLTGPQPFEYVFEIRLNFKYCCIFFFLPAWRNGRRVWLKTSSDKGIGSSPIVGIKEYLKYLCIKWMPKVCKKTLIYWRYLHGNNCLIK